MSRSKLSLIVPICVLLIGGSIVLWAAVDNGGEEKVSVQDIPAKVLEAANGAVPGGEVTAAEKEMEDGVLIYDVVKVVDGVEYEIEVTADGVVNEIEKEGEDEEETDLSDVPVKVIEAAKKAIPDAKIKEVEKEVEDGEVIYEVDMVVEYEVKVTADGVVKQIEREDDDDEDFDDGDDDDEDEEDDD